MFRRVLRVAIIAVAISLVVPMSLLAYTSPGKPAGFVNDFAGVLSSEQRDSLGQQLLDFSKSTGNEIAIVTIPTLAGDAIEDYAVTLFREWGIGNKDRNRGILVVVAVNDRDARIEVGYGLEGAVTDAQADVIIRKIMAPSFGAGKYYEGLHGATNALIGLINKDPSVSQAIDGAVGANQRTDIPLGKIILFMLFGLPYFFGVMSSSKSWWFGGLYGFIFGFALGIAFGFSIVTTFIFAGVLATVGFVIDYFLSKNAGKGGDGKGPGQHFPFWIFLGGGRGGSGGGSGFGGFGGGSSGGGGASGKW